MIIVNDGSTDQTSSVIREFAGRDPRIRQYDRGNIGVFRLSESYNFALEQSTGEYLAILEGDDFWVREKLELQVSALQKDPEAILCWGKATSVIGEDTNVYEIHPKHERKNLQYYSNRPAGTFFNIVFDDFPPPLTFLIRREALMKSGRFRQVSPFPAVDLPTFLSLSLIGPFHFIPQVLGSWRQHANQTTKSHPVPLLEGGSKIVVDHYKSLPEDIKHEITFDLPHILEVLEKRKIISYSRSGRFKLIKGLFAEAREDYRQSLAKGGLLMVPSWKLRSLAGLLFSYFRMDVEGLAKALGKKSYK